MSGDSGIKIGTGSGTRDGIPITVWHGMPLVQPIVRKVNGYGETIYPNWNSACTYGYNLPVSDKAGEFSDISCIPFNSLAGQTQSDGKAYLSGNNVDSVSDGLNVFRLSNTISYFYPTHPTENSSKQKVRGYYYDAWDRILHVREVDSSRVSWFSKTANNKMYAYLVDSPNVKIKDGWFFVRVATNPDLSLSTMSLYVDAVYYTGNEPSLYYATNGNINYMTADGCSYGQITLNKDESVIHTGDYTYHCFKINETSLNIPSGCKLALAPPRIRIGTTVNSAIGCNVVGYGFTFGQT